MNEFQLNEIYSPLKESCKILNKKLSTMKEMNSFLNNKVNELELIISSISQRTITKEEMKEMLRKELTLITNILIGKDK